MRVLGLMLVVALAGCGEDESTPKSAPRPATPAAAAKTAPKKPAGNAGTIAPKMRIEDRVTGTEKLTIRHQFRERDFVADQNNRDPFQSFVLGGQTVPASPDTTLPMDITKKCTRPEQFVAPNYSYTELRLVGIVAERTQRKVLMMDRGNLGHIIKKGDCVGREKALVKDIGAGYITFQVQPEISSTGQPRSVEEHSVQLYPNQMPVTSQPTPDPEPAGTIAPVIAPSSPMGSP